MRRAQPLVKHAPRPSSTSRSSQAVRRRCSIVSARADHLRSSRITVVATWCLLLCISSSSPSCGASPSAGSSANGQGHQGNAVINSTPSIKHFTAQRRSAGASIEAHGHCSYTRCKASAQDTCTRKHSAVGERNNLAAGGGGGARDIGHLQIFKRADTSASATTAATTNTLLHCATRQERHEHGHHRRRLPLSAWVQLCGKDTPGTKAAEKDSQRNRHRERKHGATKVGHASEAGQQPMPKRQSAEYLSARTAAMVKTLARGPSALRSGASAAAASVVAACTASTSQSADSSEEDVVAAVPPKSYLLWPASLGERQADDAKLVMPKRSLVEETGDRNGDREENGSKGRGSLRTAKESRGGAAAAAVAAAGQVSLTFKQAMFAGAVSKSIAQTCMQPANVVKTLLQGHGTSKQLSNMSFSLLTRGTGAQFIMYVLPI